MTTLAAGQGAQISNTSAPPVVISTPSIQVSVSLDDPADMGAASRLFAAPITAPGATTSFDPLPPTALAAATGPVLTNFISLAFVRAHPQTARRARGRSAPRTRGRECAPAARAQDPHGGNTTAATGRTGITQLAFKDAADGSVVPVANLSTPITFTLPPSAGVGNGTQAVCVFWDEAALEYSSEGCAALPNPLPRGLTASWLADAYVAGGPPAAALAMRWVLGDDGSGAGDALLAGCGTVFLNCSDPAKVNVSIFPDPQHPLSVPSVGCGGQIAARVLRVYNGSSCGLIANAGCYWNQTAQVFDGPDCVAANATQCACLHLTDFAAQGAPKISVCSAADLTALSPLDIITKLRFFLYLVCAMFGAMHVAGAFAAVLDLRDRRGTLAVLQDERELGFVRYGPDGAWTWRLLQARSPRFRANGCQPLPPLRAASAYLARRPSRVQDPLLEPLPGEVESHVSGSLVAFASLVGLPYARVRSALPEDLLPGRIGAPRPATLLAALALRSADRAEFARAIVARSLVDGPPRRSRRQVAPTSASGGDCGSGRGRA